MTGPNIRPLVAGNWKMNGLSHAIEEAAAVCRSLSGPLAGVMADVMIAPPATLLAHLASACQGSPVMLAGQDCHAQMSGAYTGDVAAEMLKDAGASAVVLGHSERRSEHGETSVSVCAKVKAAHRAGLAAIVCIGETLGEREAGLTAAVVARQLKGSLPDGVAAANTVIAYEPVWAIGTGLTPTANDIADIHRLIRRDLNIRFHHESDNMRILYGGSVKPDNAKALMSVENVNGALVGGASLKAQDFLAILRVYES